MFRKDPQPKASANIKSSERRKLLHTICANYNLKQDELDKEILIKILPIETKLAIFKSIQGYSGSIYYDENETPTWFKSRDSQVYPSLYTAWKCPFLLPLIKTHPHVISIVSGGANLMLPGTIPPFDRRATKGTVVGIVDSDNPTVAKAIGVCKLDMTGYLRVIGTTGIAVEVLHNIDDELYRLNKYVDVEVPLELELETPVSTPSSELPESTVEGSKLIAPPSEISLVEESENPGEESAEVPTESTQSGETPGDSAFAQFVSTLTLEEIDNFFIRSLIQTIKLETIELPIISSTFMSSYIYKNLPVLDSSYCNVKKTSWKKTSKFLKAMDKQAYLQTKGKDDDLSVIKLMDKKNLIIENFVPHKNMGSLSSSKEPTKSKKANEMNINILYKPTSKSRMFFNRLDAKHDALYSAPELRKLFDQYIKVADLTNIKNPKTIKINDELKTVVGIGPEATAREVVFKAFLKNFSPYFQVIKPNETTGELHKGEPPKINIITEMKIGRKIVTRVLNFEAYNIKPHILSDELKVKCSGSTTIGPCVQNPKITEVAVQGPHGKLIIELFKEKGVPVSYIDFEDKVKKKKKKTT